MSITRFAELPDERRVLLGIDKANLFEAGYVYEGIEVLGQIIFRNYALPEKGYYPCEYSDANAIVYGGIHLITQTELEKMNK